MSQVTRIRIGGHPLRLSNLDKELYPDGTTKAAVIDHYRRVADVLLPHLGGRPVTLKRYPEGTDKEHFYQRHCPTHRPDWLHTVEVPSRRHDHVTYCVMKGLEDLVWAANLANIEVHTFLHKAKDLERPDVVAFDLDPGPPAHLMESAEAALSLRDMLVEDGLESYAKTSGSKGIHVYVPLNTPTDYEKTKDYAREVAKRLERQDPDRFVSNMRKVLRKGKVYVDWAQNDSHKTTVSVYSLRAKSSPTVSTPVRWTEIEAAVDAGDPAMLTFTPDDVAARIERFGDLFEPVRRQRQRLPR